MTREQLEDLKPFLSTRAPFGVFAIEDGSGWFCASCGRKSDTNLITHKETCKERAHGRARQTLALALQDAGVEEL